MRGSKTAGAGFIVSVTGNLPLRSLTSTAVFTTNAVWLVRRLLLRLYASLHAATPPPQSPRTVPALQKSNTIPGIVCNPDGSKDVLPRRIFYTPSSPSQFAVLVLTIVSNLKVIRRHQRQQRRAGRT